MTLTELTLRIARLHALLSAPEPGLATWHEAVSREMARLERDWREERGHA